MNETLLDNTFLETPLINWLYFGLAIIGGLILKGLISKSIAHAIYLIFKKSAQY
jgi:hypothetical protein